METFLSASGNVFALFKIKEVFRFMVRVILYEDPYESDASKFKEKKKKKSSNFPTVSLKSVKKVQETFSYHITNEQTLNFFTIRIE